jgi:N-acetylneuraminate synthase
MKYEAWQERCGHRAPDLFIADISANHDGDLERAKLLIRLCAQAGANAAKFQNFRAQRSSPTVIQDVGGQLSHRPNGRSRF